NTGYSGESWSPVEPTEETKVTGDQTYTVSYTANDQTLTVNYVDEGKEALAEAYTEKAKYDQQYDLTGQKKLELEANGKHYVLDSMEGDSLTGTVDGDKTVTLIYSLDEDKDGIPDKYEVTITYRAVNGHFEDSKTEVTQEYT